MTFIQGWHPVALSVSIEPGSSAGTHIGGQELVVWRDNSGVAHVWEDRCPHRGMKLSFGFVRGDHIACLYHGWQYDIAGQCRYVPAHPNLEVPATIKVPVFRTVEAAGMIWTSADADAGSPAAAGTADETVPVRSLYVDCDADELIAALKADLPAPFKGKSTATIAQLGDDLFRVATGDDTLLLGLQRLEDERAALHIVIAGPAASYAGAGQAHFLAWATALRGRLEQPAMTWPAHQAEAV